MNQSSVGHAHSLYVGGVAGIALLLGFAPFFNLIFSVYTFVAVVAAVLGAVFLVVIRLRQGFTAAIAFIELAIMGAFVFIMLYGIIWYFVSYVPTHPNIWVIPLPGATQIPK